MNLLGSPLPLFQAFYYFLTLSFAFDLTVTVACTNNELQEAKPRVLDVYKIPRRVEFAV